MAHLADGEKILDCYALGSERALHADDLLLLPGSVLEELAGNAAFLLDEYLGVDFPTLLEARDEGVIKTEIMCLGLGSDARFVTIVREVPGRERFNANFPIFKTKKRLVDYFSGTRLNELNSNRLARGLVGLT